LKISLIYNVNGKLSDKLFEQMLHDFELELDGLNTSITQDQQELDRISSESVNAEKFIALVKRYTDFSELTPAMINEFIEKILVHQAEGKGASRTQEIEIFFNFVGKVEIPHEEVELTEEEIAAIAEQERRRAKKAEYNRRYIISPPPFGLHLCTTVSAANTTSNPKLFQKNYSTSF